MSQDEDRLNELNTRITTEFERFLFFNPKMDVAKDLLSIMEEKKILEDKLGLICSGQPQCAKNICMREAVISGMKTFLETADRDALLKTIILGIAS